MGKTNLADLQARMVDQIHVQKSLKPPMIILPEGVTWDMIIGDHLLRDNTGKAEWRKWGEIKAWMMHAMVWWQDALKQGGFSSTDEMKKGSGKNVDDVWSCWKMHAWQFDNKKKGAELTDGKLRNYEGKFWRVFRNTAGLSDHPMDCWKDALRRKEEGASDSGSDSGSDSCSACGRGKKRKAAPQEEEVSRFAVQDREQQRRDEANAEDVRESSHENISATRKDISTLKCATVLRDLKDMAKMTEVHVSFPSQIECSCSTACNTVERTTHLIIFSPFTRADRQS
jgi:hypothetical protein